MEQQLKKVALEMMNDDKVLARVAEHAAYVDQNASGIRVITFLQGSQNYGMSDEESDVDTKSLVVPSFSDLVLSKSRESHTLILSNEEHADVKDVREMFNCWKKQNVNFVEALFTKYVQVPEEFQWFYDVLYAERETIAHYSLWNTLMATCGHMTEKFTKLKHAGVARTHWVEKYGYDPKQLCHLLRLKDFLTKYFDGCMYEKCLKPSNPGYLLAVKRGLHTLGEAEFLADDVMAWMEEFRTKTKNALGAPDFNSKVDTLFNDLTLELFREVCR